MRRNNITCIFYLSPVYCFDLYRRSTMQKWKLNTLASKVHVTVNVICHQIRCCNLLFCFLKLCASLAPNWILKKGHFQCTFDIFFRSHPFETFPLLYSVSRLLGQRLMWQIAYCDIFDLRINNSEIGFTAVKKPNNVTFGRCDTLDVPQQCNNIRDTLLLWIFRHWRLYLRNAKFSGGMRSWWEINLGHLLARTLTLPFSISHFDASGRSIRITLFDPIRLL